MSELKLVFNKHTKKNHLVKISGSTIEADFGSLNEGGFESVNDLVLSEFGINFNSASSGSISLLSSRGIVKSFDESDELERGIALIAAMAEATSGAIITLGPGIYDLAASQLVMPVGVKLAAAGKLSTTIKSSYNGTISTGTQIIFNDLCQIRDLTISSTQYETALGNTVYNLSTPLRVRLVGVSVTGSNYALDVRTLNGTGGMQIFCVDCDFNAEGNAVEFVTNALFNGYVRFENCNVDCTGLGLVDTVGLQLGGWIELGHAPAMDWIGGSCNAYNTSPGPSPGKYAAAINGSGRTKLNLRGVVLTSNMDNPPPGNVDLKAHDIYYLAADASLGVANLYIEGGSFDLTKIAYLEQVNIIQTSPEQSSKIISIPGILSSTNDFYGCGLAGLDKTGDILSATATNLNGIAAKTGGTVFQVLEETSIDAAYTSDHQPFPNTPVASDAVYFGATAPFCNARFTITTLATYTGNATIWEYYNGSTWATLTGISDVTDATAQNGLRSLQTSAKGIQFIPPTNWAITNPGGVGINGYYIRLKITTAANMNAKPVLSIYRRYLPAVPLLAPVSGYIKQIIITDGTTGTVHTNVVKFFVMNFSTGAASIELTSAVSRRKTSYSDTVLHASKRIPVNSGDNLYVVCTAKDGTNEIINGQVELVFGAA